MSQSSPDIALQTRPVALFALALTGVLASTALGAVTNSVNAWISPIYFVNVLGWQRVENVWRTGIAQGAFEGACFGVVFALVFSLAVAFITGAACTYGFAARHLVGIVAGAFVFWILGGILATILAAISPEFYRATFIAVPNEFEPLLAYAWVGGSIWGIQGGGFVSLLLGLVVLRANWHKHAAVRETAG